MSESSSVIPFEVCQNRLPRLLNWAQSSELERFPLLEQAYAAIQARNWEQSPTLIEKVRTCLSSEEQEYLEELSSREWLGRLKPDERASLESQANAQREMQSVREKDEERFPPPRRAQDVKISQMKPEEFDWPAIEGAMQTRFSDEIRKELQDALNGLLAGKFIRETSKVNADDVKGDLKKIAGHARRLAELLSNPHNPAAQIALLETEEHHRRYRNFHTEQTVLYDTLLRVAFSAENIKFATKRGRAPHEAEKAFANRVRCAWRQASGDEIGAHYDPYTGKVKGRVADLAKSLLKVAGHLGVLECEPSVLDALRKRGNKASKKT